MRYAIPHCPECGKVVAGERDYTPGLALVMQLEDGSFEYEGETDMYWDGQVNERDFPDGTPLAGAVEALIAHIDGSVQPNPNTATDVLVDRTVFDALCNALTDWKAQRTNGIVAVECPNGHQWDTMRLNP